MRFDPPAPDLVDREAGIRLRPWRSADAGALVAAWEDPDIARYCAAPQQGGVDQAAGWIAGWAERAETGRALDLVVAAVDLVGDGDGDGDSVLGEVGVTPFGPSADDSPAAGVLELGWWVRATDRRRGVASAAVVLVADWAGSALGATRLVARIRAGHKVSETVATRAGFTRLGRFDGDLDLWARAPEGPSPGATVRL